MAEQQVALGLCVVGVLALVVMAVSSYRIAYPSASMSFMTNPALKRASLVLSNPNLRHQTCTSDNIARSNCNAKYLEYFMGDGQYEAPSFYNIGDMKSIRERQVQDNAAAAVAINKAALVGRLNSNNYSGTPAQQKNARDMDMYAARNMGLVKGPNGKWSSGGKEYFSDRLNESSLTAALAGR